MKIAGIIQARMGSTRLENKMLQDIEGQPLIFHVFNRLKTSEKINFLGLATTNTPADDILADWAQNHQIPVYRGS